MIIILYSANIAFAGGKTDSRNYPLQVDKYGPVVIGMTPVDASAKLSTSLNPAVQPDAEDQACYYVYPGGNFDDIGFMVEDGRITRIDIYSKKISSVGGIHIGDSEESVKQIFPGKVKEENHPYIGKEGKYLVVVIKPGFAFVFETERGKITTFRSGRVSSVKYIEGCL
jgi:hypothetical protein